MKSCSTCSQEFEDDVKFCPACGTSLIAGQSEDPLLGQKVAGNFLVEKFLGEGGMGRVYVAQQLSLKKDVVIKVLHRHLLRDKNSAERFRREAYSASRLDHPNSIRIIDFGRVEEDGSLFIAMEFLKNGRELTKTIREESPLDSDRVARIMKMVCSVLFEAHSNKVIHRDLKPENIMLIERHDEKDFVKVLDFGIAKVQEAEVEEGKRLTMQGMVCGTPEYMSPEQARGEELDPRSDIYSLGIILYEMLTGNPPFTDTNPHTLLGRHIHEVPKRPSEVAAGVEPELERICMKAVSKRKDDRYGTCLEMEREFDAFLKRSAGPATTTVRTGAARGRTMMFGATGVDVEAAAAQEPAPDPGPQRQSGGTAMFGAAPGPEAGQTTQTGSTRPSRPVQAPERQPEAGVATGSAGHSAATAPATAAAAPAAPTVGAPPVVPSGAVEQAPAAGSSRTPLVAAIIVGLSLAAAVGFYLAGGSAGLNETPPAAEPVAAAPAAAPAPVAVEPAVPAAQVQAPATVPAAPDEPAPAKPKATGPVPKARPTDRVPTSPQVAARPAETPVLNIAEQPPKEIRGDVAAGPDELLRRQEEAAELVERGNRALAAGETARAKGLFLKSLELNPKAGPVWKKLGMVYLQGGEKDKAKKALQRYLQLSPQAPDRQAIQATIDSLG